MQRLERLFGWSLAAYALLAMFGETTGPLLILLTVDGAIGILIVRSCTEMRAATPQRGSSGGGH